MYCGAEQWDINYGSWGGYGTYLFDTCLVVYLKPIAYLNAAGVYTSHSVSSLGTRLVARYRKSTI